jgi:hypothetical protein
MDCYVNGCLAAEQALWYNMQIDWFHSAALLLGKFCITRFILYPARRRPPRSSTRAQAQLVQRAHHGAHVTGHLVGAVYGVGLRKLQVCISSVWHEAVTCTCSTSPRPAVMAYARETGMVGSASDSILSVSTTTKTITSNDQNC